MKPKPGRDFLLLIALCAIGLALGRAQTRARNDGRVDYVGQAVTTVVNPVASLITGSIDATADFTSGVFQARALRAEVRRLQGELNAASLYTDRVQALLDEIDSLRKLNGIGRSPGRTRVPADVIGFFPKEHRMVLNVGADRGLTAGLAVVTSDGILGVVSTVSAKTSQVSLLSTLRLRIGAMIQRQPPVAGLIEGAGGGDLMIELNDPKAPVKAGDLVVTSGLSEKIPRGLIVGRVLTVEDVPEMGARRATVFPSASVARTREVVVLR